MRHEKLVYVFVLCVGLMLALQYAYTIAGCADCTIYHRETMAGISDSPYRYRLLAPALATRVTALEAQVTLLQNRLADMNVQYIALRSRLDAAAAALAPR